MATRKKKNNIGSFGHPIYGKGFAKYGEMRTNSSSEIPSDLEEAAEKYAYKGIPDELKPQVKPIADEIIKNFIAGYNLCKEQMLKDAVEGTITCHNLNRYILVSGLDESLTYGDKVRVFILKKDK